jgi:cell cycle sensor histidine kinase DivJ
LTSTSRRRRSSSVSPRRDEAARFAVAWHLAWGLAIAAAAAGLSFGAHLPVGPELMALAVAAVPAVLGALLALSLTGQTIAILLWGMAGAVACIMTGGALGPLAAWCLAPLAAACALRRAELLPLGVAAAVAAAGVAVLGTLLLPLPTPSTTAASWLSLLALATVALGLGAGLINLNGRSRQDLRLRDERELALREVLEHQPQLLLGLAPGGRILDVYGEAPVGMPSRGIVGRAFGDLVSDDQRRAVDEAIHTALADGSAEIAFAPAHDVDGWCELSLRRMSETRVAAALRDSRAQRTRETALERARDSAESQNAGKSRFLANMSHELRTPLNAIMGFSDIMRQRLFGPVSDRYAEYAELIHESGAHLLELINDVLDMSKIEAERFELAREDFDARDAVSAVLRLMRGQADRAGVNLRGVLPPEPLEADADRRAIKQIALNLISNALKFTPRGGAVTVTVQGHDDMLELIVADTGTGIGTDDLARLGRPYEQAGDASQKANGTGLGLSLVRAFAKLHGGDMRIESAVGDGTTVIVRLPVLLPPLEPAQIAPETPMAANH